MSLEQVNMSWESHTLSIEPRIIPRYTFNMPRDIFSMTREH
jgi:hypothetical protein